METFIDTYCSCKSASAYWVLKMRNGDSVYSSNEAKFSKSKLTAKLKLFEKELGKHGITFMVVPWTESFESEPYEIVPPVKRKFKIKGSFVFTTENAIHEAALYNGEVLFAGSAKGIDSTRVANALFKVFKGMLPTSGDLVEVEPKNDIVAGPVLMQV